MEPANISNLAEILKMLPIRSTHSRALGVVSLQLEDLGPTTS